MAEFRGVSRFRPYARRAAACALAAAFTLLLTAGTAQAQTSVTLVSNTGQNQDATSSYSVERAQPFTTGSNAAGYKLTSVTFPVVGADAHNLPTVRIESSGTDNKPGGILSTLTLSVATGAITGTASGDGIDLDPNTTYFVTLHGSNDLTRSYTRTNSNSEDTGGLTGWSIGDGSLWDDDQTTDWDRTSTSSWRIAIKGYAKPPPKVTGVEISSTPSLDVDGDNTKETYGLGEKIQVQATFDKNVTVTGTPRLKIKMDPNFGEFWANYESGSGSKVLTFAYTVASPNMSPNGIAVLENTLELNGGTIKDGTVDAALAHTGLAHNAAHKVNSGLQPATPETPKSPADQRPRFASGFGPLRLEPDVAMTPATLPAATGGGGAPYTYVLTSSPTGLAGLSFNAGSRILSGTPEAEGSWTFTYAATDANGGAAILSFRVTVGVALEEQQEVVRRALAEVASRTIAGAVSNIGTRLGDAAPSPGMTIAGEQVSFGASGTGDGADERWAAACPGGGFHDGFGRRGFETVAPGCAPRARSRGVAAGGLLPASAFSYTLGAAEGDKGIDPRALRWAVWGRGDFGSFSGRPDGISSYRGETRTGWLGVDAREAPRGSSGGSGRPGRWVAGLAISRGMSETDYVLDGEEGRIETDLTALWPYGRWTFANGLELRGMLGAGRGEARHETEDGIEEKSRLSMWTGSAGLRRPLPPLAGIDLAARGDVSLARMQTDKGDGDEEQAVDGILADAWRLRGGMEASRPIPFDDGSTLTPFVETAARRDGGDGVTGTGLEVAGGLRVAAERLQIEARGRWLAAHSEKGAEERGVSLTARAGPGAHGRGLSVVLSPRWGAPVGGVSGGSGALWREELPRGAASGATGAREASALDGELGYGFGLNGGRFTGTPNVGFGASDGGGRDYRVGWRLTPAVGGYSGFQVNLDATRRESANANEPPAHGAMLTGAIRW